MRLELEELESRTMLSASGATPAAVASPPASSAPSQVQPLLNAMPQQKPATLPGFSPKAIQQAYGVSSLLNAGTNGKGVTIAIVDASYDPSIVSDVAAFNTHYGLQQFDAGGPTFSVVTANGTPITSSNGPSLGKDANWAMETALDVEWAHSLAPNANIVLVEAQLDSTNAQQLKDLLAGVTYAANNGANVVSMSWGVSEFAAETGLDSTFAQNPNVTFVAASGDNSAFFGPIWPATSPYVLAVGGTSLTTTTSGGQTVYKSENGWFGSGGGFAGLEGEPNFQTSAVGPYGSRLTPDVAFDANPNTGVSIYDAGHWYEVGGTSVGSPVWAGIIALADQQYQTTHPGSSLGTYQVESTLYSALNSSGYTTNFHDVTRGSNGYSAGRGYDLVTGLGSPIVNRIVPLLAGTTVSPGFPSTTGQGTGFFSSSSSGFGSLGRTGQGGGLFAATGSPSLTAGSESASGFGSNAAATPPVSTSVSFLASAMTPSVETPLGGSLAGNPAGLSNNTFISFNLAVQASPPGLVSSGNNLSGTSNAPVPTNATVFGASGWAGSGNSWRLNNHGLHGPMVEEEVDELVEVLFGEPDNHTATALTDEGVSSDAEVPVLDSAVPAVEGSSAGQGGE